MCEIGDISRKSDTVECKVNEHNMIAAFFFQAIPNLLSATWQPKNLKSDQALKKKLRLKIIRNPEPKGGKYHNDKSEDEGIVHDYNPQELDQMREKLNKHETILMQAIEKDKNYKRVSLKAEIIFEIIKK